MKYYVQRPHQKKKKKIEIISKGMEFPRETKLKGKFYRRYLQSLKCAARHMHTFNT